MTRRWTTGLCAAAAIAAPAAVRAQEPARLVLVAPPPSLVEAVTTSLAPWHTDVIVVGMTDAAPTELASTHAAGFVAVVRGRSIELFDRLTGISLLRPLPATLDDAGAAALALALKTWMRLERPSVTPDALPTEAPPPEDVTPAPAAGPPAPTAPRPWRATASAALGVRLNQGGFGTGARAVAQLAVGWRWLEGVGAFELGPSVTVTSGTATSQSQLQGSLRLGPRLTRGALWVRPTVGVGVVWNTVSGTHMTTGKPVEDASADLAAVGAVDLGWRRGRWFVQATVGAERVASDRRIGQLRMSVDAHIEPWIALGVGHGWP